MADGPALKLFHSILTLGPIAFSNHPLALPTMACGCVMLGNAPTRMTVWPNPRENHKQEKTDYDERFEFHCLFLGPLSLPGYR